MASGEKRSGYARILRNMSWDYGIRAGLALDLVVPREHRDKRIARALNVSLRMAQYLRAGKHWTTDRLNQASVAFVGFDKLLASSDAVHHRLDELEQEVADLRALLRGESDAQ